MLQRLVPALLVLAGSTVFSYGYPIPPVPLWDLTKASQLIVLADVIEIIHDPPPTKEEMADPDRARNAFRDATARLRVRETWKGDPLAGLEVRFPEFLICPAPPRYIEGHVVLAFLRKNEDSWETTALSYGTIYPRKEDTASFRELVLQAVTLQLEREVLPNALIKWHVEAASHAGTRWHGLYFLVPDTDELHSYYDKRGKSGQRNRLTPAELRQIAEGFAAVPPTDRTLPMALAILSDLPDESVTLAAVSAVEALLAKEDPPWWLKDAFEQIFRRYGEEESAKRTQTLGKEFSEVDPAQQAQGDDFSDISPEQMRAVWEEARKRLGIPRVPPAKILVEEVWGVASNTPS